MSSACCRLRHEAERRKKAELVVVDVVLGCNAFQVEPAWTATNGSPFIVGCTPPLLPYATCLASWHHDGRFVIRIPDDWNGHLLTAGTPGIRDAFSSDFILSDYAMEKGWAYVSQDEGNMAANFYQPKLTAQRGDPELST